MSDLVAAGEAAAEVGLSYRRVNYWIDRDYLLPIVAIRNEPELRVVSREGHGSGYCHLLPETEVRIMRLMVRMTNAGIHASVAALHARRMVEQAVSHADLGHGLMLVADMPEAS